jgi:hypothetical protein
MTDKEKHIVDFLKSKDYESYYIDIRDKLGKLFDNESDFDNHLESLKLKNWIYESNRYPTLVGFERPLGFYLPILFSVFRVVLVCSGSSSPNFSDSTFN